MNFKHSRLTRILGAIGQEADVISHYATGRRSPLQSDPRPLSYNVAVIVAPICHAFVPYAIWTLKCTRECNAMVLSLR